MRRLVRHFEVTAETVLGALCVYLLIGLAFAYVYAAVDTLGEAPFFAQIDGARTFADFVYFSYVTQATVGYGDLTAATTPGPRLAVANGLTRAALSGDGRGLVVGNLGNPLGGVATGSE
jgi:hypothetical protein